MFKSKAVNLIIQILPFAVIGFAVAAVVFTRDGFTVQTMLSYAPHDYFLAALFLLFLFIVKSLSIVLPISVLYVLAGILFPVVPALLLNAAGCFICVASGYLIGYFSASKTADRMAAKHPRIEAYVEKQRENEWFISYILRVFPISCDLVSVYLGSLRITPRKYLIASMAGSVPGIVSATLLGTSIQDPLSPTCIVAFSMILLILVFSFFLYAALQKRKQ